MPPTAATSVVTSASSLDADLPEITRAMADDNLLVMPVLDPDDRQIGVLTIDDILEATIPPEWRRRRE